MEKLGIIFTQDAQINSTKTRESGKRPEALHCAYGATPYVRWDFLGKWHPGSDEEEVRSTGSLSPGLQCRSNTEVPKHHSLVMPHIGMLLRCAVPFLAVYFPKVKACPTAETSARNLSGRHHGRCGDVSLKLTLLASLGTSCRRRASINCPGQSLVLHVYIILLPAGSGVPGSRIPSRPGGAGNTAQQERVCRGTLSPISCWQDWSPGRTTKLPCFPGPPGDKTPVWNKKRLGKCWPHSLLPH
ncbi:uncharacterized protein LOC142079127 [Calonectris borealis]|uniref:uncharacterized protein LOC142079127 n=1 Tax=Calonectris borealis TaxID=1323832 RepID=UPI003F4BDA06